MKIKLIGYFLITAFAFVSIIFSSCVKRIQIESYLGNDYLWTMYGQTSERKFFVKDTIISPFKVIHKIELKAGLNRSSVTARDGFLFVGDLKGNVYKINIADGKIKNYNNFKQPVLSSIIVLENEIIFPIAATKDKSSYLIVYNLIRGEERIRTAVEGSIENEILLTDDGLVITTSKGMVYKLNRDYKLDWKIDLGSPIYSHPAAGKDFFVTGSIDGTIALISFKGEIIRRIKLNNSIKSGFTVEGSKIYFGDEGGFIHCYDKNQDKFIYSQKLESPIAAIPALDEENIFAGDLSGNIFCLKKDSGNILWRKNYGGLINNAILIAGNKLVVPNYQKKIFILDKYDGKIFQELEFEGRVKFSPIIIDKKLITGCDDKKIFILSN